MNCNKCGFCCIFYDLVVPHDPEIGIKKGNLLFKIAGKKCHLLEKDGSCKFHDKDGYKESVCYSYDTGDKPCSITKNINFEHVEENTVLNFLDQDSLFIIHSELAQKNKELYDKIIKKSSI